jgi:hypothetical protein
MVGHTDQTLAFGIHHDTISNTDGCTRTIFSLHETILTHVAHGFGSSGGHTTVGTGLGAESGTRSSIGTQEFSGGASLTLGLGFVLGASSNGGSSGTGGLGLVEVSAVLTHVTGVGVSLDWVDTSGDSGVHTTLVFEVVLSRTSLALISSGVLDATGDVGNGGTVGSVQEMS